VKISELIRYLYKKYDLFHKEFVVETRILHLREQNGKKRNGSEGMKNNVIFYYRSTKKP
jgi:hypothetical protein